MVHSRDGADVGVAVMRAHFMTKRGHGQPHAVVYRVVMLVAVFIMYILPHMHRGIRHMHSHTPSYIQPVCCTIWWTRSTQATYCTVPVCFTSHPAACDMLGHVVTAAACQRTHVRSVVCMRVRTRASAPTCCAHTMQAASTAAGPRGQCVDTNIYRCAIACGSHHNRIWFYLALIMQCVQRVVHDASLPCGPLPRCMLSGKVVVVTVSIGGHTAPPTYAHAFWLLQCSIFQYHTRYTVQHPHGPLLVGTCRRATGYMHVCARRF